MNSSSVSGLFPTEMKISKMIPLHKKGKVIEFSNYRPFSLIPSTSKIFERAMNEGVNYLERIFLFEESQHGFQKNKSVVTTAVDLIESIIDSIDSGENLVSIYMDLSESFNNVSKVLV